MSPGETWVPSGDHFGKSELSGDESLGLGAVAGFTV